MNHLKEENVLILWLSTAADANLKAGTRFIRSTKDKRVQPARFTLNTPQKPSCSLEVISDNMQKDTRAHDSSAISNY